MKVALFWTLITLAGAAQAAGQVSVQPRLLTPTDRRAIRVVPFQFYGTGGCDRDGNMYFHVGRFSNVEIFKLTGDGSQGSILSPSARYSEASKAHFSDSSVTPSGTVYVLAGYSHGLHILKFDKDGNMEAPISLEGVPQDVGAVEIVASDDGAMLLFSYYDHSAPASLRDGPYLAVLGPSGNVVRQVDASSAGVDIAKLESGDTSPPGAALSDDGNFYFAGPKQLLVISPGGELVRHIPFTNPGPKSTPSDLYVSGGLAAIRLDEADEKGQVHSSYLTLSTASGEVVGWYQPAKQLGSGVAQCFSADRGFTFLQFDGGHSELLTAPLQ